MRSNVPILLALSIVSLGAAAAQSAGDVGAVAYAAQGSTAATSQSSAELKWDVPKPTAYDEFFGRVAASDEMADTLEKEGKDGSRYRNDVKGMLGFNEIQMTDLREAVQRHKAETGALSKQSDTVWWDLYFKTKANREEFLKNHTETPEISRLKEKLTELGQQREDATMHVVEELKRTLGPEASAKMENWVYRSFGRNTPAAEYGQYSPLPPGAREALVRQLEKDGPKLQERMRKTWEQKEEEQELEYRQRQQDKPEVNP
jgi:hypothetical protein